jgi:hypothetical protein
MAGQSESGMALLLFLVTPILFSIPTLPILAAKRCYTSRCTGISM